MTAKGKKEPLVTTYRNPHHRDFWFVPVAVILFLLIALAIADRWLPDNQVETLPARPEIAVEKQEPLKELDTPVRSVEPETLAATAGYYVLVGLNGFKPVTMQAPASSTPLNIQLAEERYSSILKEPEYTGRKQWYGYMDLGNRKNRRYHFVLDHQNSQILLLYFDRNNNLDLSDDGMPLRNTGSGSGAPGEFACRISIPWKQLILDAPFDDDFNIWFFSNRAGWENGRRVSHYSQTQLQGTIQIDGTEYTAWLVDRGPNDADLTNDGILIDLNSNGKVDPDEKAEIVHTIGTEHIQFNISW